MLLLLSPAKTLDFETPVPPALARRISEPLFNARAADLIGVMRRQKPAQVAALMGLSDKLAVLNVERYAAWREAPDAQATRPAAWAFAGDVYVGLDAHSMSSADWTWAQQHVVILSGLYGALKPLDRLQAYRLEMGTAVKTRRAKDLYAYWGDAIAEHLNERQAGVAAPVVVNLASVEYATAALRPALRARVVECVFEDWKGGRYKIISFFAKQARGMMARHAIERRAKRPEDLLSFSTEGYAFAREASEPDRMVFRRRL
jgi:cytoplasmic iron level regulating protein YaaA (DUF328/UPF0246 family)